METLLPCTSQKSSRPTGRGGLEGRVGLCVIHYSICMHVHRIQSIAQISTRSNFRRLCDFTRKCRTWRKTLLSRRLINPEQAQRRTLAYDRLFAPGFSKNIGHFIGNSRSHRNYA